MITLLSGWVANFALKFSSPEYFAVYFLAFATFSMGAQSPFKTLVSMMLGFALASIGMDTISGNLRLHLRHSRTDQGRELPDCRHGTLPASANCC